jgi:hypothetical protein
MPFPNPDTQFQPGQSGNPEGKKPGTIHLSTHIQNMLNDPDFELLLEDRIEGFKKFEGVPIKAIITVAVRHASAGDTKWAEWLAKYGYGQKFELEHSGEIVTGVADPELASGFAEYLKNKEK